MDDNLLATINYIGMVASSCYDLCLNLEVAKFIAQKTLNVHNYSVLEVFANTLIPKLLNGSKIPLYQLSFLL